MELIVSHITKAYGEKTVLEDLSLTFESGGRYRICGPSGRGKTTLLRLILGLEKPQSGTITGVPDRKAAVFQEDRLCRNLTVMGNLRMVLGRKVPDRAILDTLAELGIEQAANLPASQLSGGMAQRVALCRALAAPADTVLLDEPFRGLDPDTRRRVMTVVRQATCAVGRTLLLVTHAEEEAVFFTDRIIRLP